MIFSLLSSNASIPEMLITLLIMIPTMLFALSLHETAHGYVAWKCGDNTAYNLGRLTLNPFKHIDPIGFVCLLLFGYGWAKAVPINTRNFKNPKRGMALSALAGPLSNLILGLICALLCGVCWGFYNYFSLPTALGVPAIPEFLKTALDLLTTALLFGAQINFVYMVFNMIPVPPFDGSRILLAFLPSKTYFGIMRYERQIMLGVLIVMLILSRFGISPFGWIAEKLTEAVYVPVAKGIYNGMTQALL